MVCTTIRGDLPNFFVPEEFINTWVEVIGDLHNKVEKNWLLDIDFTDATQFLQMVIHAFMDFLALSTNELQWGWKSSYVPLRNSTLMNLYDSPMFGTIGDVTRSTKFLISHVHNNTLWLDQAYPIHVEDIHKLTSLSMEGEDVKDDFQASRKHVHKKGELSLYEKYDTNRGGRGVHTDIINDE